MEYPEKVASLLRDTIIASDAPISLPSAGNSMAPWLRQGDKLTISPAHIRQIKLGDVIVFESEGRLLCHRVIARKQSLSGAPLILAKPDAGWACDPPVIAEKLLGKVIALERQRFPQKLDFQNSFWKLTNCLLGLGHALAYRLFRALKPLAPHA